MADNTTDDGAASGVNDLTPEEVSRIIHSHRKVRYGQSTLVVHLAFLRHVCLGKHFAFRYNHLTQFLFQVPRVGLVASAR